MAILTLSEYKQLSGITDEAKDELIALLIPIVEEDYQEIRGKPFATDTAGEVIYPSGSKLTAKLMLDWLISPESGKALGSGMQQEQIGKYSYELGEIDADSGYPKAIIGRIQRYVQGSL